MIAYNTRWR